MSKLIKRTNKPFKCRADKTLMKELRQKDLDNEPIYIQDVFKLNDFLLFKEYDYKMNRYVKNGAELLMAISEIVQVDDRGMAVILKEMIKFRN